MESAPFAYAQLKVHNDSSSPDRPLFEFLTVNTAFEKITGLEGYEILGRQYLDLPLSFTSTPSANGSVKLAISLSKDSQTLKYYSRHTRCHYIVQVWPSENGVWNYIFQDVNEQLSELDKSDVYLKSFEYDAVIEELNEANETLNATLVQINAQREEQHIILDSISDMVTYLDVNYRIIWANKKAYETVDKSWKDIIGHPCYQVCSDRASICHNCPVEKAVQTHTPQSAIIERADGRLWDVLATPVFDAEGRLTGIVDTFKDITESRNAENALKQSEEKYRNLTERIEVVLWEYDIIDDKWVHVSPQVTKLLGYEPEEWTDYNFWYQNIHPDDREWASMYCSECTKQGINHVFEYRFRRKDGRYVWLSDDVSVGMNEDKAVKMWGSMKNISAQKKIEHALRESEEKLSTTLHSIGDGVIATNTYGMVEAMNPVAESLCGWKLAEIKGKPLQEIFNIVNATTRQPVMNPVKKVLESGQIMGLENHTILIAKDGTERQIADSAAPIKNKQGDVEGVVLVFSDVTEKYAIQKKIEESEEKFRLLITQMEQGLALHEAVYDHKGEMVDYRFVELNESFEKLTGLKRDDILGKTVLEVLPETEAYWIKKYGKVVKTGTPVRYENYSKSLDKFFEIIAYRNREHQFATVISDITKRKQFEEKIKTSDKIFQHSIDMLCVAGFDGYFKVLNPSWERTLGWSEQELLAKPWIEFVHPDDRSQTVNIKKTIDKGIEIYQFENRYICKDNSIKWLSWNTFPYEEENIMFGVARDITLQKQVETSLKINEEKYRLLFDKSPVGILHFNQQGVITLCNAQFADIIGTPKEQIIGLDMMHLSDQRIVDVFKDALQGKMSTFLGVYTTDTSGKTIPVRVVATPVVAPDGSIDGGIALVEDQTGQMERVELEKKVAVAEDSVKFKQQFLANMSHEIRTPLTGILGMVEILEQTQLSETQLDYLVTLKHSGENLKEIINLILDFSKIEAGKVHLRKNSFEFRKVFPVVKSLFQSICNKPILFETHIDPCIPINITADESRILQILNNLISNAVKFTERGKIIIGAQLLENKHKHLKIKISITDTGMGIPEEKQGFLFSPFTQLDPSNSRTFEGTGLGLSICKELATLHGGEIGLESKLGEGSTFWFTFMANKAPRKIVLKPASVYAKESGTKVKKIILAEDKIVNQKVFRIMLTSLGHEVTIVNNGKQLLEVFKPGLYDIIFMDIQMPEMDGLTATRLLKEKYTEFTPIVGLSANAFEGDKERFMDLGMDDYLMKPVKREDFSRILDKFFGI